MCTPFLSPFLQNCPEGSQKSLLTAPRARTRSLVCLLYLLDRKERCISPSPKLPPLPFPRSSGGERMGSREEPKEKKRERNQKGGTAEVPIRLPLRPPPFVLSRRRGAKPLCRSRRRRRRRPLPHPHRQRGSHRSPVVRRRLRRRPEAIRGRTGPDCSIVGTATNEQMGVRIPRLRR